MHAFHIIIRYMGQKKLTLLYTVTVHPLFLVVRMPGHKADFFPQRLYDAHKLHDETRQHKMVQSVCSSSKYTVE